MTEDLAAIEQKHFVGTWRRQREYKPMTIVDAEGCYFYNKEGKRFLDFSSQAICCNLGHKHRDMIKNIHSQMEKFCYVVGSYATEPKAKLVKLLAEIAPKNLKKTHFATGGTDANEAAIKITRWFTGSHKIISRYKSYHGSTLGSITLTGDFRRIPSEPGIWGVIHAPEAYCYRCPFGMEYPDCGIACAEYTGEIIDREEKVGGVFVEPIPGANGILVPPKEYLPRLREICDETSTLLIADEIMTGFGRTGEWFAVDNYKVSPDIMTLGKGITAAYIPFSATMISKEIADFFEDHLFAHGHTYAGHTLACAAGVSAIEIYKKENLVSRAKKMGKILEKGLKDLKEDHRSIGDVRGVGLLWGVELVKNRKTRESFPVMQDRPFRPIGVVEKIRKEAMDKGLYFYSRYDNLLIGPPLIIKKEEINEALSILDEVLKLSDKECD